MGKSRADIPPDTFTRLLTRKGIEACQAKIQQTITHLEQLEGVLGTLEPLALLRVELELTMHLPALETMCRWLVPESQTPEDSRAGAEIVTSEPAPACPVGR